MCSAEQSDAAWRLASSVLTGAALGKALEQVVRGLAETCVRTQQLEHDSAGTESGAANLLVRPTGDCFSSSVQQMALLWRQTLKLVHSLPSHGWSGPRANDVVWGLRQDLIKDSHSQGVGPPMLPLQTRQALSFISASLAAAEKGCACAGMHGSSAAWQALRLRLADRVSGVYGGLLRVAAVDAILSADRRMSLPAWLLEVFKVSTLSRRDH